MEVNDLNERVKREQQSYDAQSIVSARSRLKNILRHANEGPSRLRRDQIIRNQAARFLNGDVLEIESQAWGSVFCRDGMQPKNLTCINISQVELDAGIMNAQNYGFNANFKIMDAHNLSFPENSFDLVYGVAILHHLNFEQALKEIWRVLRPNGEILFVEPLRLNPVAQLVRLATPNARTTDELPLGPAEIGLVSQYFNCSPHYSDLITIPASVLSRFIYRDPVNAFTRSAEAINRALLALIPHIGYLFRTVTLLGSKREKH